VNWARWKRVRIMLLKETTAQTGRLANKATLMIEMAKEKHHFSASKMM